MKKSLLVSAIVGASAAPAFAQTATTAGAGAMLEEVVVTAQRREEDLQDLPVSASALDGETLKDLVDCL
jgi:outer membrane receptor protein involved in Fe transport